MRVGALEAGGTKMVCAVVEIGEGNAWTILNKTWIPTTKPQETIPKILEFFRGKKIVALGIACFGPIDLNPSSPWYGHITSTPKKEWENYNIVGAFAKELQIPIGFDTDVNGSLLGEATFGCAKDLKNSIYITIGTGIGAGIMCNGALVHGMLHPEAGHITLKRHSDDTDFLANCPYHSSCFEGLAAGSAVEKRWGKKGIDIPESSKAWGLEAYYIGQALVTYIMILSPEKIILGGGVMHQPHLLSMIHHEVVSQMNGYIRTEQLEHLEEYIVTASLGDDQGILGAACLARKAYRG